ncbi:hypothetical protein pb186bvf_008021 [Paramecium bursaria]
MILYNREEDLPIDLLCRLCYQISENPVSCPQCKSIYCLECIENQHYYCECPFYYTTNQQPWDKLYKLDPHSNNSLDKIKCLCQYCNSYISYKKYKKHSFKCHLIKTNFKRYEFLITIYNSNNEEFVLNNQMCNECKNTEVRQNCQECKVFLKTEKYNDNENENENQIQINGNLEVSESQFNLKYNCFVCNAYVKYAELHNHQIKCILNRNYDFEKEIRSLKQEIEKQDSRKCYQNINNYHQLQNFRQLNQQYKKHQKIIELIEKEQSIDSNYFKQFQIEQFLE